MSLDLADQFGWEPIVTSAPPEHLDGFAMFIRNLFPIDNLYRLKIGPISEHEKQTIRSLRDWFDQRDEAARSSQPAMAVSPDS